MNAAKPRTDLEAIVVVERDRKSPALCVRVQGIIWLCFVYVVAINNETCQFIIISCPHALSTRLLNQLCHVLVAYSHASQEL